MIIEIDQKNNLVVVSDWSHHIETLFSEPWAIAIITETEWLLEVPWIAVSMVSISYYYDHFDYRNPVDWCKHSFHIAAGVAEVILKWSKWIQQS